MRFQRTQNALTFCLALVAALPLIASMEIGWVFSGAFFLLWAAGWFVPQALMRGTGYRRGIAMALLAVMLIQLGRLALGVPMARLGMEFIAVAMGMRLVSRGFAGDYYQIVILAFLHIIAATVAIDDLLYGVCFLFFVALSSPVLALTYLRQEMENRFSPKSGEAGQEVLARLFMSKRIVTSGFVVATSALSIPVLIITAVLFLLFPRLGMGFFGRLPNNEVAVGFGEKVTLGDFDVVRMEETVLLRLVPENANETHPARIDLKIRGAVYDVFIDDQWQKSPGSPWRPLATHQQRYLLDRLAPGERGRGFEVLVEPLNPKLLFVPEGTGVIQTDLVADRGDVIPRKLQTNRFGEIRYSDDAEVGIRYRIELTDASPFGEPPGPKMPYLALPKNSERLIRLARDMAPGESPRQIVHQLVTGLRTRYHYSLALSSDERNQMETAPLERFLFSRKTGTCEHFATALTLLLRAKGIPSRLVTGFSGADWNSIGRFYSVRKRTAHSWTEAYLEGRWVTLDATPGADEPGLSRGPSMVSLVLDTLRMRWHKHVIGYDLSTQGKLLIAAWRYWRSRSGARASLPKVSTTVPVLIILGALVGWGLYRLRQRGVKRNRGRRSSDRPRPPQIEAARLFAKLDSRFSRLGYPRPPSLTPNEHLMVLRRTAPTLAANTTDIIKRYNEVRFGTATFRAGEVKQLGRRIRALRLI